MAERSLRQPWIDVARGILIILVVAGHSSIAGPPSFPYIKEIYWFHMPAFFILSGSLFNVPENWSAFKTWVKRRAAVLLIPYLAYLAVEFTYRYTSYFMNHAFHLDYLLKELFWAAFGGRFLVGVYWFTTCFFFTQVLMALLFMFCEDHRRRWLIILCAYMIAHLQAIHVNAASFFVPWDLDVSLAALIYMALGYYISKYLADRRLMTAAVSFSLLGLVLNHMGLIDYRLDMKYLVYTNPVLDLIMPVSFSLTIFTLSRWLSRTLLEKPLAVLGVWSLPVMYLHLLINKILMDYFSYGYEIFILVGIVVPVLLIQLILERFQLTRRIFLGKTA